MKNATWNDCVAFHGHSCGGLTIGWKAALYAIELLELKFSDDEEVCCICENDACCVDAIQVMLGCSAGKGNLMFHLTGKMAFSFYERSSGKSVRLMLKPRPEGMSRQESFDYYQGLEPRDMFDVKPVKTPLPEGARGFENCVCAECGEEFAECYAHLVGGRTLCRDCYRPYTRYDV